MAYIQYQLKEREVEKVSTSKSFRATVNGDSGQGGIAPWILGCPLLKNITQPKETPVYSGEGR